MTLKTFFWAIFGMSPIESADVVIENLPGDTPNTTIINHHKFTEAVGYIAFARKTLKISTVPVSLRRIFHSGFNQMPFFSVSVSLGRGRAQHVGCVHGQHVHQSNRQRNCGVGVWQISGKFNQLRIISGAKFFVLKPDSNQEGVEIECIAFQIYLSFMAASTLPPPFNLLPTAAGIKSTLLWLKLLAKPSDGKRAKCNISHCCYIVSISGFKTAVVIFIFVRRDCLGKRNRTVRKHRVSGVNVPVSSEISPTERRERGNPRRSGRAQMRGERFTA